MKPDGESQEQDDDNPAPISGDAIGDTAYSERFVLKLLLKFANLDTLKLEMPDKSFEEDLCTLWDMTAEKDVVEFLQKHKFLNLLNFALPTVESPRILEIIVGIIGNMCCQKSFAEDLFRMEAFFSSLLEYIKSDDSLVLIQVLRLVNASLYAAKDTYLPKWMELFENTGYSAALYFMLMNSSNKDLLINALENVNTLFSYCKTELVRQSFVNQFVSTHAIEAITTGFNEIAVAQKDSCEKEELERVLVIMLQIFLNLIDADNNVFANNAGTVASTIETVLNYYNNKIVNQNEIDTDLTEIVDSTNILVKVLNLSQVSGPEKFFMQSFSMWQSLRLAMMTGLNGSSNFEEVDKEELQSFSKDIEAPLSTLICRYVEKCSEENLLIILDQLGSNFEDILRTVSDKDVKDGAMKRTVNYRSRLKENVDS